MRSQDRQLQRERPLRRQPAGLLLGSRRPVAALGAAGQSLPLPCLPGAVGSPYWQCLAPRAWRWSGSGRPRWNGWVRGALRGPTGRLSDEFRARPAKLDRRTLALLGCCPSACMSTKLGRGDVHDPHRQTLTAVLSVTTRFALLDERPGARTDAGRCCRARCSAPVPRCRCSKRRYRPAIGQRECGSARLRTAAGPRRSTKHFSAGSLVPPPPYDDQPVLGPEVAARQCGCRRGWRSAEVLRRDMTSLTESVRLRA